LYSGQFIKRKDERNEQNFNEGRDIDCSVDAVCGVGDMIYIPWVWFGQSGIAKVKITGMCIDDEGLRYCFNLDSDDERFIREYGELYSYHFGAKWFLDKAEAKARLEELKVEAE